MRASDPLQSTTPPESEKDGGLGANRFADHGHEPKARRIGYTTAIGESAATRAGCDVSTGPGIVQGAVFGSTAGPEAHSSGGKRLTDASAATWRRLSRSRRRCANSTC